jgi:hypothetical protein
MATPDRAELQSPKTTNLGKILAAGDHMATQENDIQQPDPIARDEIPSDWAKVGHCPACQSAPLQVVHLLNATDYLICRKCELAFEVELDGARIRIKNVPDQLGFMEQELRYHWVEPSDLTRLFNNHLALRAQQQARKAAPGPHSDEEVMRRAISLYRMGNKPKMVEFILIQAGATPEQAQAAFVSLKQLSAQEAESLNRKFQLAGGIILLLAVVYIISRILTPILISAQLQQGLASPADTVHQSNVFLQLLDIVPDGVKPGFLKPAPARWKFTGPARLRCPFTLSDAAGIFGGEVDHWTHIGQSNGWQMMNADASVTISLPEGMHATFMDNRTGTFYTIDGPATIRNINYIAILCK